MQTAYGHLTFCTNIFPGETWGSHSDYLRGNLPLIKNKVSPEHPMALGLRLSNKASEQLEEGDNLKQFKDWLKETGCYVLSINGFPYGNFHKVEVKEKVHAPDWSTPERLQYTERLFRLLVQLLPEKIEEGGVSTSPLSYRHWFNPEESTHLKKMAAENVVKVAETLIQIQEKTGKMLHLDIEPEADGVIESSLEFISWFQGYLLPIGIDILRQHRGFSKEEATEKIINHIRLCLDVCHFSVGFEDVREVLSRMKGAGIKIGRWQLSSALKAKSQNGNLSKEVFQALEKFDESVYLHQVVARQSNGELLHFPDLSEALQDEKASQAKEWRSHFHVPLFIKDYGVLSSTQDQVEEAIACQKESPVCRILEVETYTWDVLPADLKLPLSESITRELTWVKDKLTT